MSGALYDCSLKQTTTEQAVMTVSISLEVGFAYIILNK